MCVSGFCKVYYPPCPPPTQGCTSDVQCLTPGACQPCPDGSCRPEKSWCDPTSGKCITSIGSCPTKCQPIVCNLACPNGYAKDANGCDTCACAGGGTGSCSADADCEAIQQWCGCQCMAWNKNVPPPPLGCAQPLCGAINPCAGKTAYCALDPTGSGTCQLK
jgi:hypothetical protein